MGNMRMGALKMQDNGDLSAATLSCGAAGLLRESGRGVPEKLESC